jgi:hypothetical protein
MEIKHDQFIGIYKNAISHEWCDKVIDYFEKSKDNHIERVSESPTRDKAYGLWYRKDLIDEFKDNLTSVYKQYKYKYPWAPIIKGLFVTDYKIQKTLPTEGFHNYHIERGGNRGEIFRAVVYTVYLNDVEEGGETEFLYQLKRIPPEKGTICLFPADYTHPHRGNTPYSNPKYIMTGWLELQPKELHVKNIPSEELFEITKFWK